MFKELKEHVEKVKKTMYDQNENISKEIENLKRGQKEILELKSKITEIKNSLEEFKCRFEQAKERISKLKERTTGMIKYEEQKVKRLKKSEQNLRDLRYQQADQHRTVGVPEREERKKTAERISEEIMAENFPNSVKNMNINIQQGTSLAVQWLRLCASTAGGMGSIPGQGTKIPHAVWCSQKKKLREKYPTGSISSKSDELKAKEKEKI